MAFKRPKPSPANKALKARIRSGEKFVCPYCRETIPPGKGTVDHVVPLSRGGTDDALNLVVCCSPCNSRKSDFTLDEFYGTKRPKRSLHPLDADVMKCKKMAKKSKNETALRLIDQAKAHAKLHFAFLF